QNLTRRDDADRSTESIEHGERGYLSASQRHDRIRNYSIGADRSQIRLHDLGDFHKSSLARFEHTDRALRSVSERVTDERIGTGFDEPGLENSATSDRNRNGLYSLERVGNRPVQIHAIEDRAHDMERRKPIRSGV